MKEYKVSVQQLIDHIKTAIDVDPWAKEMAEELLKEQKQIVRCKDCKHRTRRVCNNIEFWECNHLRYDIVKCGVTDDWFCADGEAKE